MVFAVRKCGEISLSLNNVAHSQINMANGIACNIGQLVRMVVKNIPMIRIPTVKMLRIVALE